MLAAADYRETMALLCYWPFAFLFTSHADIYEDEALMTYAFITRITNACVGQYNISIAG